MQGGGTARGQEGQCMTNKYRAIKTGKYASKGEAARAQELALLARAGAIADLAEQIPYLLIPAQRDALGKAVRPCVYIADFVFTENGKTVVEDFKGMRTPVYLIKKKLMLFVHGITVRET